MDKLLNRAKILFDLNGFIVIRGVLSPVEVAAANEAIDRHHDEFVERKGKLRNSSNDGAFAGDLATGRFDLAGMLGWAKGDRDMFRRFLCHPKLIPYLHMLVGESYRLDHMPLVLGQKRGSEGFNLHGGTISAGGRFIPELQYVCRNEQLFNSLIGVSFQLTEHNEGDGGFCVVKGSHKLNFALTHEMMSGQDEEFFQSHVQQPVTKAGDVVIFSEGTIHGCLPWNADHERRVALYRFAPSFCAYARGYSDPQWPASFLEDMTPEELAVMEPPYNKMFDRPKLDQETSKLGEPISRSDFKKQFDMEVFKNRYY